MIFIIIKDFFVYLYADLSKVLLNLYHFFIN